MKTTVYYFLLTTYLMLRMMPAVGQNLASPPATAVQAPTLSIELATIGDVSVEASSQAKTAYVVGKQKDSKKDSLIFYQIRGKEEKLSSLAKGMLPLGASHENLQVSLAKGHHLHLKALAGAVRVKGLKGEVSASVEEGALTFESLQGYLYGQTAKGNILVKNSSVHGTVETYQGNIVLENPHQSLQAFAPKGTVTTKITHEYFTGYGQQSIRLYIKESNYEVEAAPKGAFLYTDKGDITIKRAKDSLLAFTAKGQVVISSAEGAVYAASDEGNVSLTYTGKLGSAKESIKVISEKGDITLYLPAEMSATLYIEQEQTDGRKGSYSISSDFALAQPVQTPLYDQARQLIGYQTLHQEIVNGGTSMVHIRAVNGHIHIKKR